jgi:YihY family inner membrane protein
MVTFLHRLPAQLRRLVASADRFQQRHRVLAFPVAVVRKMSNDQGGSLAALIAHYGFLSLFPLILVFSAVLGFLFTSDPALKAHAIRTVARSFPSLSGFVTAHATGSGLALGAGGFIALWAGLGVTRATERAMNTVWDIPMSERPNLWRSRLRGLAMLGVLGIAFLVSTGLAGLQQTGGALAAPVAVLSVLGPLALNFGLYLVAFQVLTNRHLTWRAIAPGAAAGAAGWTALQSLGALYVRHEVAHASQLYGTLASVIGLLAWLYLGSLLTLYAAEINVVIANRLWPRSLSRAATTDADRRALVMMARTHERVAGEVISVTFHDGEPPPRQAERAERELSTPSQLVHDDVGDVVTHLHAFDRYRRDLEHDEDESRRQRLQSLMRVEATETARDLAHLAAEEPTLADALADALAELLH